MEIKNVKGTHDILWGESSNYSQIETLLKSITELFAYKEVRPPVLEHSELFVRGVGESSDIVRKEMYTFLDKGDRSLTLRPEFTAGIIRLIVQNKLYATNELPLKCYYCGPVFRYERPQLGRYRQFNQFGVESVGNDSPYNDVEVITMAYTMLCSLGLDNVKVKINTLGDETSRENYKKALKEFFSKHIENMCEDCKQRYELNPLRILDCKDEDDIKIIKDAPKMSGYLSDASKARFEVILKALTNLGISYEIDEGLVRGLDYYSDTVFEFHYTSRENLNYGAIGAGGHYSKLVSEVGGPEMPGIGFSFGVERLYSVLKDDKIISDEEEALSIYVMPLDQNSFTYALNAANILRLSGYKTDVCFDQTKLGNMFKRAERKKACFALIVGENEVKTNKVVVKNLSTQEQNEIDLTNMTSYFDNIYNEHECSCQHEEGECHCGGHHHHDEECECGCGEGHHEGHCCCHDHDKEER